MNDNSIKQEGNGDSINERGDQFQAIVDAVDAYVAEGTISLTLPNGWILVRDPSAEQRRVQDSLFHLASARQHLDDIASRVIQASEYVDVLLGSAMDD
jgi:hypothetical protein